MVRLAALFVAISVSFGGALFNISSVLAATYDISIKGPEKFVISVPEAVINVQANTSKKLRIVMSEAAVQDYRVHMDGTTIRISVREPLRRETFGKITPKKRLIEIQGPPMSLEIHAFEGQIQLNKWNKEALLHVQKGRIVSRGSAGTLLLHSQTGDIQVFEHQGRLHLDTYKSKVEIKNLNGELNLENFAGRTLIEDSEGSMILKQGQGPTRVLGSSGHLEFSLIKGSLFVQTFEGEVEGDTQEGSVAVRVALESDIHITSQKGKVTLNADDDSGAFLNLSSTEGDLTLPSGLKVNRSGGQKSFKGRLLGESQKGRIVVRSEEGNIVVR